MLYSIGSLRRHTHAESHKPGTCLINGLIMKQHFRELGGNYNMRVEPENWRYVRTSPESTINFVSGQGTNYS